MSPRLGALVVLATTARVPLLTKIVERLAREPQVESRRVGGVPAMVVRPGGRTRAMAVFLNGGTALGCDHPAVQRLTRGLARAGYLVIAPELPGLRRGELTPATLTAAVGVTRAAGGRGPVGLFGVSAGASLALLAAADETLSGRVSVVVSIAPYADLDRIVRLATTGDYAGAQVETAPLVREVVARSLLASCPADCDVQALARLCANRDPDRFDELRAALPREVRHGLELLSPLRIARRLDVPVELASAADDGYFPLREAESLAAAAPRARLTVTSLLDHVRLRPSLAAVPDFIRFWRFTARSLRRAAGPGRASAAEPARFVAVGAAGYGVNVLAFARLYGAHVPYAIASLAAYLVANALMYLGNRYLTFRLGHDGFWAAYRRYVAAGLVVAGLTLCLLTALVQGAGIDPRVGQGLALLLVTPPAFVLFKRWTFRLRPA